MINRNFRSSRTARSARGVERGTKRHALSLSLSLSTYFVLSLSFHPHLTRGLALTLAKVRDLPPGVLHCPPRRRGGWTGDSYHHHARSPCHDGVPALLATAQGGHHHRSGARRQKKDNYTCAGSSHLVRSRRVNKVLRLTRSF